MTEKQRSTGLLRAMAGTDTSRSTAPSSKVFAGEFHPDVLLGAFASALKGKGLSPFVVKYVLEKEGFFEPGKMKILEYAGFMLDLWRSLLAMNSKDVGPLPVLARLEPHQIDALYRCYESLQKYLQSPQCVRTRWKMVLEGTAEIISTAPSETAPSEVVREFFNLMAYEQLVRSHYPNANLPSLEYARHCITSSIKRPSHRPSSGDNGVRFRTGAVGAALFFRETNASPQRSWKWVADRLNRSGVTGPKGRCFRAKTIENWSTKGSCNGVLLRGMRTIARAKAFAGRTPLQLAEAALVTAIHFQLADEKLPNHLC
jgi:hypothetical protein